MNDNFFFSITFLIIIFGIAIVAIFGVIHLVAIGQVAEYHALKNLVTDLGTDARTEDILGKVADWNMMIAGSKKYNQIPLVQFFVLDKIANLDYIVIPKRLDERTKE